jgi:hypothetical protein
MGIEVKKTSDLDKRLPGDALALSMLAARGLSAAKLPLTIIYEIELEYKGEGTLSKCSLEFWEKTHVSWLDYLTHSFPYTLNDDDWVDRVSDPKARKYQKEFLGKGMPGTLAPWMTGVEDMKDCPKSKSQVLFLVDMPSPGQDLEQSIRVRSDASCECTDYLWIRDVIVKADGTWKMPNGLRVQTASQAAGLFGEPNW